MSYQPITPQEAAQYRQKLAEVFTLENANYAISEQELDAFYQVALEDDGEPLYLVCLVRMQQKPVYAAEFAGPRHDTNEEALAYFLKVGGANFKRSGAWQVLPHRKCLSTPLLYPGKESWAPYDFFYIDGWPTRRDYFDLIVSDGFARAFGQKLATETSTLMIPCTRSAFDARANEEHPVYDPAPADMLEPYIETQVALNRMYNVDQSVVDDRMNALREFHRGDDGHCFHMLNLIIEREEPMYLPEFSGYRAKTSKEAKDIYLEACKDLLPGYLIFDHSRTYASCIRRNEPDWRFHQFYLVHYPNRLSYMAFNGKGNYVEALQHKIAGDAATLLIPVEEGHFRPRREDP